MSQSKTKFKRFETERLLLRPFEHSDAAFLVSLLNCESWLKFIGDRNVHSKEDAIAYINERMIPQLKRLGYGNNLVIRKDGNIPMGACGLYERPGLPVVDVGFAFLPEYEGQGYGYEAASRILMAAEKEFGLKKICAITSKQNFASQKLLQKLRLHFIKHIRMEGDNEDVMYYEIDFI